MEWLADPAIWASFVTLAALEIVLGIDNLVFIALLAGRLPPGQRDRARKLGLALALGTRLVLLGSIFWMVHLTYPVLSLFGHDFSWRDLILIGGGLFLIWKATTEIHHHVAEAEEASPSTGIVGATIAGAIGQIVLLDLVFSIDSIVTAVGMTNDLPVMVAAVLLSVGVMLAAAGPLSRFIAANPTIVMLALGFLLMIGMVLVAEGTGLHVPKGYIYTAMAFSVLVEGLNLLARRRRRK